MNPIKSTVLLAAAAVLLSSVAATAGTPAPAPVVTAPASLWERETLTGDWFGHGASLREHGITFTSTLTQFYGGLMSGDGSQDWQDGGKLDAFLRIDGAKIGLWQGFGISAHYELNYGRVNQHAGGVLLPNNAALLFPGSNETLSDLSLYFTQQFGKRVTLMAGKINMVDMYDASHDFSGGRGVEQFQHLEFVAPLSGITPPMIFGAILSVRTDPAKYTLMIYDPASRTRQTGFEDAFEKGVTFNGSVELPSHFGGKPGKHVFTAAYSTQDGLDFRDIPELIIPGGPPPGNQNHRWYFAYGFEQTLWQDAADPKKAWGLFGQAAVSDGNPNPAEWSALAGVGGTSPLPGRSRDKFGLGVFYLGYSGDLKDAVQQVFPLEDEYGAEVFYNCALTPWFRLTADLQVVHPPRDDRDTAVIGGLRAQVVF